MLAFGHGADDEIGLPVDAESLADGIAIGKKVLARAVTQNRHAGAGP